MINNRRNSENSQNHGKEAPNPNPPLRYTAVPYLTVSASEVRDVTTGGVGVGGGRGREKRRKEKKEKKNKVY